jgi:transposase
VLLAYLEQVLVPKLRQVKPDAILVMDNLRPHHATQVRDLLAQAGIGLLYLPRYSPEFNPIEQAWAKMKERLKAKAARTLEALEAELKPPSTPSPQRMPEAGSGMPAMPYFDPKSALTADLAIRRPVLVRFASDSYQLKDADLCPKARSTRTSNLKPRVKPARRSSIDWRSWPTRLLPLRRRSSGELARTALTKKRSHRKSATSVTMRKPEREQRKRCGR